jgi:CrcB protein
MAGSALGGVLRYALTRLTLTASVEFPYGTILINVLGSFVIGYFGTLTLQSGRYAASDNIRLFVMVGICGGFTTFSAFSLQTFDLMRSGAWDRALANVVVSIVLRGRRRPHARPSRGRPGRHRRNRRRRVHRLTPPPDRSTRVSRAACRNSARDDPIAQPGGRPTRMERSGNSYKMVNPYCVGEPTHKPSAPENCGDSGILWQFFRLRGWKTLSK